MADLGNALEARATSPKQKTVFDLLERQLPAIEQVLPATIGAERFARIVKTEIRRTPKLLDCNPDSLLGAMMLAAQLGLEPGPLGHVYFVPYKTECQFIIGYRGFVDLAYRSGLLKSVSAVTVRAGDEFSFRNGTRPYLDHTPAGPPDGREPTHYFAVAALKSGGNPFVVLYPEDVEKARKRSAAGRSDSGPWTTDYDSMARKTAIRRLANLLPQSPQVAQALAVDEHAAALTLDGEVVAEDEDGDDAE